MLGSVASENLIFLFVCELPEYIYSDWNWPARGSRGFLYNIALPTIVLRLTLLMDRSVWGSFSMISPLKISSEELLGFWSVVTTIFLVIYWQNRLGAVMVVSEEPKTLQYKLLCIFFLIVYLVSKAEKEIWDTANSKPKKVEGGRWGQGDRLGITTAVLSMNRKDANSIF